MIWNFSGPVRHKWELEWERVCVNWHQTLFWFNYYVEPLAQVSYVHHIRWCQSRAHPHLQHLFTFWRFLVVHLLSSRESTSTEFFLFELLMFCCRKDFGNWLKIFGGNTSSITNWIEILIITKLSLLCNKKSMNEDKFGIIFKKWHTKMYMLNLSFYFSNIKRLNSNSAFSWE